MILACAKFGEELYGTTIFIYGITTNVQGTDTVLGIVYVLCVQMYLSDTRK